MRSQSELSQRGRRKMAKSEEEQGGEEAGRGRRAGGGLLGRGH